MSASIEVSQLTLKSDSHLARHTTLQFLYQDATALRDRDHNVIKTGGRIGFRSS